MDSPVPKLTFPVPQLPKPAQPQASAQSLSHDRRQSVIPDHQRLTHPNGNLNASSNLNNPLPPPPATTTSSSASSPLDAPTQIRSQSFQNGSNPQSQYRGPNGQGQSSPPLVNDPSNQISPRGPAQGQGQRNVSQPHPLSLGGAGSDFGPYPPPSHMPKSQSMGFAQNRSSAGGGGGGAGGIPETHPYRGFLNGQGPQSPPQPSQQSPPPQEAQYNSMPRSMSGPLDKAQPPAPSTNSQSSAYSTPATSGHFNGDTPTPTQQQRQQIQPRSDAQAQTPIQAQSQSQTQSPRPVSRGTTPPSAPSAQQPAWQRDFNAVVDLIDSQPAKHYVASPPELEMILARTSAGGTPKQGQPGSVTNDWDSVWLQLSGISLSMWSMKETRAAAAKGDKVPPTYFNITDSSLELLAPLPPPPHRPTSHPHHHVFSLNTAGSNRLLFSCPTERDLARWSTGLRLASWERARLEEIYTGHLIKSGGKEPASEILKGKGRMEGWVRARVMGGTDWKRLWLVLSTPKAGDDAQSKEDEKKSRRRSFFGLGEKQPEVVQEPNTGYSMAAFYLEPRTAKNRTVPPVLTINNVTQSYAVFPERLEVMSASNLMKVVGRVNGELVTIEGRLRDSGWALIMPEAPGEVAAATTNSAQTPLANMMRWVTGFHDVFKLYGRPERYIWDKSDPRSLFFAYPEGGDRSSLFLEVDDAMASDFRTANLPEIRKQFLALTKRKMSLPAETYRDEKDTYIANGNSVPRPNSIGNYRLPPLAFDKVSPNVSDQSVPRSLTPISERTDDASRQNSTRTTKSQAQTYEPGRKVSDGGPSKQSSGNSLRHPGASGDEARLAPISDTDEGIVNGGQVPFTEEPALESGSGMEAEAGTTPQASSRADTASAPMPAHGVSLPPINTDLSSGTAPVANARTVDTANQANEGMVTSASGNTIWSQESGTAATNSEAPTPASASTLAQVPITRSVANSTKTGTETETNHHQIRQQHDIQPGQPQYRVDQNQSQKSPAQVTSSMNRSAAAPGASAIVNGSVQPISPPSGQPNGMTLSDSPPSGNHGQGLIAASAPTSARAQNGSAPSGSIADLAAPIDSPAPHSSTIISNAPTDREAIHTPVPRRVPSGSGDFTTATGALHEEPAAMYLMNMVEDEPVPAIAPAQAKSSPPTSDKQRPTIITNLDGTSPPRAQPGLNGSQTRAVEVTRKPSGARPPPKKSNTIRSLVPVDESSGPPGADRPSPETAVHPQLQQQHVNSGNRASSAAGSGSDIPRSATLGDISHDASAFMAYADAPSPVKPKTKLAALSTAKAKSPEVDEVRSSFAPSRAAVERRVKAEEMAEQEVRAKTMPGAGKRSGAIGAGRDTWSGSEDEKDEEDEDEDEEDQDDDEVDEDDEVFNQKRGSARATPQATNSRPVAHYPQQQQQQQQQQSSSTPQMSGSQSNYDVNRSGSRARALPPVPPTQTRGSVMGAGEDRRYDEHQHQPQQQFRGGQVHGETPRTEFRPAQEERQESYYRPFVDERPRTQSPATAHRNQQLQPQQNQPLQHPQQQYQRQSQAFPSQHSQQQLHTPSAPTQRQTVWNANFSAEHGMDPSTNKSGKFVELEEPSVQLTKAFAPHGLLQAGLQDKEDRSAKKQEEVARETGSSLINVPMKPPPPQTGLLGAVAAHERDRKNAGGIGATLTDREREKRLAEERGREVERLQKAQMEQMRQFGGGPGSEMYGGSPGGQYPYNMGMMGMPPMGYGGYQGGYNPYAQQQAMMAAQMAYQQAMMMSQHGGSQAGGGGGGTPDRPSSPVGSQQHGGASMAGGGGPGYGFPPSQSMYGGWPGMQPPWMGMGMGMPMGMGMMGMSTPPPGSPGPQGPINMGGGGGWLHPGGGGAGGGGHSSPGTPYDQGAGPRSRGVSMYSEEAGGRDNHPAN